MPDKRNDFMLTGPARKPKRPIELPGDWTVPLAIVLVLACLFMLAFCAGCSHTVATVRLADGGTMDLDVRKHFVQSETSVHVERSSDTLVVDVGAKKDVSEKAQQAWAEFLEAVKKIAPYLIGAGAGAAATGGL